MRSGDLLSIDASAELATLCEARLQGPWQAPTELMRMALARGASDVQVDISRTGFRIRAGGARVRATELDHLATALDPSTDAVERHRAIVALEGTGADPLLFTAALDTPRVMIRSASRHGVVELRCPGDRTPRPAAEHRSSNDESIELQISGSAFDSGRAAAWLREACRFVPQQITLDDSEVAGGFTRGLFRVRLQAPLPCQLAVTREGDAPRLYLLQHGLVATRATVPGFPAFHGAVEMSSVVAADASPARLREAVTPYLPELIDQAVAMLIRLVPRLPDLDEAARCRITTLLLRAARQGLRRAEIFRLPIIETVDATGDRHARWRVGELVEHARSRGGIVPTLTPEEDPRHFMINRPPAAVLSADERAELLHIVDLRLEQPPPVRTLQSAAARLRRAMGWVGDAITVAATWITGLGHSRALQNHELEITERQFLQALAGSGARWSDGRPAQWRMRAGRGPMRRDGKQPSTLLLARDNTLVRHSLRAVARDPAWLYPTLAALATRRDVNLEEPRRRWRAHIMQ